MAIRADITDDLDVQRLSAETIAAFGGIDVVVHAVGSRMTPSGVIKVDLDELDALVRLNTRATFVVKPRDGQAPSQRRCDRQPVQFSHGFFAEDSRSLCSNQGSHRGADTSARARAT